MPAAGVPRARRPQTATPIQREQITGVVLAGGRGSRMGGQDKGLLTWQGTALAQHALQRLQPQVGNCLLSANRNLETYTSFGVPVVTDTLPGFEGPLAGLASALNRCTTPWLAAVPCDVPGYPEDVVVRLAQALADGPHLAAFAICPAEDSMEAPTRATRAQPAFCLLSVRLLPTLDAWLAGGGRRFMDWWRHVQAIEVFFADARTFTNANTPAQLQALQT